MPAFAGFEAQRQIRIKPLLASRTAAIEPARITRFATQGDFALAILAPKFAPKSS